MKAIKQGTIDDYLAAVERDERVALQKLRRTIRTIVPDAVGCISYKIPAFRFEGRIVAGFAATKSGCSYFPFSGQTLQTQGCAGRVDRNAPERAARGAPRASETAA